MRENIREKLDKAIDDNNIVLADQMVSELFPGQAPAMPEGFAEKIQALATEKSTQVSPSIRKKQKRYSRKFLLLAATLILLLAFVTIAYAAGLLLPSVGLEDGTATMVNATVNSNEYKAASEYAAFLNQKHTKLEGVVFDPVDYPIYADSSKVQELSKKYYLKYATSRTDIKSLDHVARMLKEAGIPNFLGTALDGAKPDSVLFDEETGFTFNDGNFYIRYIRPSNSKDLGDDQIAISYTPIGSFPWNGFCLSPGEGTDLLHQEQAFTYKSKSGMEFICVPEIPKNGQGEAVGYSCFSSTDEGYITISMNRQSSHASELKYEAQRKAIDQKYEKKARSSLNIGLKGLEDRALTQWNRAAWDNEPDRIEKAFLVTTDTSEADKILADLETKYSTASPTEKNLYKKWQNALNTLGGNYSWNSPISRHDLSSILEAFKL